MEQQLKETYSVKVDASKHRMHARNYYQRNREQILLRQKQRYQDIIKPHNLLHKEEISQKRKAYYQNKKIKQENTNENPDKTKEE